MDGDASPTAGGINDIGVVVVSHGFLLNGTHYTTIDYPGSSFTQIYGLNDLGQLAVNTDNGCGFLYELRNNTFTPLPCVGIASFVTGINNRGQFSGFSLDSVDPNNVWHGFIATPVR
jgi:hypothetical protein